MKDNRYPSKQRRKAFESLALGARSFRQFSQIVEVEIPTLTGLLKRASSETLSDTLRRVRRWINGIMKPPNAIVVPQMMVRVAGRYPQRQSMYFVHCFVSIFRFLLRTTRREHASVYRPIRGQSN